MSSAVAEERTATGAGRVVAGELGVGGADLLRDLVRDRLGLDHLAHLLGGAVERLGVVDVHARQRLLDPRPQPAARRRTPRRRRRRRRSRREPAAPAAVSSPRLAPCRPRRRRPRARAPRTRARAPRPIASPRLVGRRAPLRWSPWNQLVDGRAAIRSQHRSGVWLAHDEPGASSGDDGRRGRWTRMSDELTALDATFLELEEADQSAHMHIGAVMLFEPRPEAVRRASTACAPTSAPASTPCRDSANVSLRPAPAGSAGLGGWTTSASTSPIMCALLRLPAPAGEAELREWAGEYFSGASTAPARSGRSWCSSSATGAGRW